MKLSPSFSLPHTPSRKDEFMGTAGEFVGEIFIQTWFLRHERGLIPARDQRCVDFARLVIMSCDLARMGDYELMSTLWACLLHRFDGRRPSSDPVDLEIMLNVEFVREVFDIIHTCRGKELDLLLEKLVGEAQSPKPGAEADPGARGTQTREQGSRELGGADERKRGSIHLSLRHILRFCYQHPPLLFPIFEFQRALRSKVIGEIMGDDASL